MKPKRHTTHPIVRVLLIIARECCGYRDGPILNRKSRLKDGHPVADVTLVKGTDWKTVSEKLD